MDPHITHNPHRKGRGAGINPDNRFARIAGRDTGEPVMPWALEDQEPARTSFLEVYPKTILSKNDSPDLGFNWSLNPYSGCEHGCAYCYARNTHEYWGYSAGRDFEEKILVKKNAPELLEALFSTGKWQPAQVVLSGNTDCYQPAERKFEITRKLLQVFQHHRHPVTIITKNALVLRDLDILAPMAAERLVSVAISVTTLREPLRRVMEPRTASVTQRLEAISALTGAGVPVVVMMAPLIYNLNSDEIFDVAREAGQRGAHGIYHTLLRLNGQVAPIFEDWLRAALPERADKVLNHVRDTHGGHLSDSRYGKRMKGEGHYAREVADMFRLARAKWITAPPPPAPDYTRFTPDPRQLRLF